MAAPAPPPPMDYAKRAALYDIARSFVARVGKGFDAADEAMGLAPGSREASNFTPEGPMLFNITLGANELALDNMVAAEGRKGRIYVSLADYFMALEFPITVDARAGTATGWYVREDRKFALDMKARSVIAGKNEFVLSDAVQVEGDDILVPPEEVATWFGFKTETLVSNLQLRLIAPRPLPVEERLMRKGRKPVVNPTGPPQFPLMVEGSGKSVGYPIVGVTSTYSYARDGEDGTTTKGYSSNVLTRGDFLKGRLDTESQFNNEDRLASLRASYVRESLEPELLGPLKARRYQLGNMASVRMPVGQRIYQGAGARVSNVDPARIFTSSATGISGNAPPGWDVELYRGSQFIESQTTGDDGFYHFDSVDLFRSKNNFRVMLYGPQGQIREQTVSIPVDPYRLSESGSAYDVALSFDNTQVYRKETGESLEKEPRLSAIYEQPVGDRTAVDVGFTSGMRESAPEDDPDNARIETLHGGISTAAGAVLFNAGAAVESTGEVGGELVARADYGTHQFRNALELATEKFSSLGGVDGKVFEDTFTASGPFPLAIGRSPRYNVSLNYGQTVDTTYTNSILGYSGIFGRVSLNQQFRYGTDSESSEDNVLSETAVRGSLWGTYIRGDVKYKLIPETTVSGLTFNVQKPVRDNLDIEFEHNSDPENEYSENRVQMNWRTQAATISPSIIQTSDGDTIAYMNTSFSAMPEPDGKIRFSNQVLGGNGLVNVLVFLDKNGNGKREDDEIVLPEVTVVAPQNGGEATTGKDGYAHLDQLQSFKQTDLYIMPDTLKDPFWLPASKGISVMPREGHLTEVTLPVHVGGQIEGALFKLHPTEDDPAARTPVEGGTVSLYNNAGEKILSVRTEYDGYYNFSPVLPGDYYLVVDDTNLPHDAFRRPDPAVIKIGYDGTDITGKDIYLEAGMDVPVRMMTGVAELEKQDPALDEKTLAGKTVVLNLGAYHSRVLMSVMWFKLQKMDSHALAGLVPLVDPGHSYASAKTGEHTLRVGASGLTLKGASERCRIIVAAGHACTVEVLPGGMQLAAVAK